MEIECRTRDLSTYDVFEIYENRLQGETTMASATIEYLSASGFTTWSEWDLCTGRSQTLFRESVKFSNFEKILWPYDSSSKISPKSKF